MELSSSELVEMYRCMLLSRHFDKKVIKLYNEEKAIELPHSHIGQEAVGVGACFNLGSDDYIVPSLRTRPALITRGIPLKTLMAGIFAKATGPARSKVTTHHMGDPERGIIGTTGVVGAHISIAAGVALACKMKKKGSVVLCFFGDGASNKGDFHEALNFVAVKKLPVVFVIENNLYGMWTPFSTSFAIKNLADRAAAYGFPGVIVDGNDVLAVHKATQEAVKRARQGEGSTLIECKTYRLRGHVERKLPERRPGEEVEKWRKRDPIKRFEKWLLEEGMLTPELIQTIEREVNMDLDEAIKFAERSPFPKLEEALKEVYGGEVREEYVERRRERELREVSLGEALKEALREEMERNEDVILLGEDIGADAIGPIGGLWPPTRGLCERFPNRVIGTPISESGIVGAAVGAALVGMRPVVEIMYADFITTAMDQIVNSAAKMRYNYNGEAFVPLVIRAPFGAGRSMGMHHSQSPEAWFLNVPGLKIVMPSTPYDAKGLLKASIRDDDPVIFFEPILLYGLKGQIPKEEHLVSLGKASIKREGDDVTLVATGLMVQRALSCANEVEKRGISVEIVDPRTLLPLDKNTIIESVKKTNKLVIVHEAPKMGGFGSEVAAVVAEEALEYLDAPIIRVGAPFTPVPFSPLLEKSYVSDEGKIISAVLNVVK